MILCSRSPSSILFFLPLHSCWSPYQRVPVLQLYPNIITITTVIIIIIILGLDSIHEQKRGIFLLSLTYLIQHDGIQFHPFSCKQHNFILLYGWITLHFVCVCLFIHSLVVGHLGCFHGFAIMNSTGINMSAQAVLFVSLLSFGPRVI
jgi:hypothetical protein